MVSSAANDPRCAAIAGCIAAELPLQVLPEAPFLPPGEPEQPALDLRRFSRYWRQAEPRLAALLERP